MRARNRKCVTFHRGTPERMRALSCQTPEETGKENRTPNRKYPFHINRVEILSLVYFAIRRVFIKLNVSINWVINRMTNFYIVINCFKYLVNRGMHICVIVHSEVYPSQIRQLPRKYHQGTTSLTPLSQLTAFALLRNEAFAEQITTGVFYLCLAWKGKTIIEIL